MKKKILSAVVAGVMAITLTLPAISASATPDDSMSAEQQEFVKLDKEVSEVEEKVQKLDNEISPLVGKINKNKSEISNINKEVDNTKQEIDQSKEEISEKEEVLGKRLRELYKSGGQTSYISLIFSADSFSDLVSKVDSASRLVNLDKKVVKEIVDKQEKLNDKVKSLEVKGNEIKKINEDIQKQVGDLDKKKEEHNKVAQEAKDKRTEYEKKYLVPYERGLVSGLISSLKDSSKNSAQLTSARNSLKAIHDGQLKSPIVKAEVKQALDDAEKAISRKKREEAAANTPSINAPNRGDVSATVQAILDEAYRHIGKPYVWGGKGPDVFDCSGFTSYVYSRVTGMNIGGYTGEQINSGKEVSRADLRPGDLVFPHSGHVGIYVGDGMMIHAPKPGDKVKVAPVYAFWRARRILN